MKQIKKKFFLITFLLCFSLSYFSESHLTAFELKTTLHVDRSCHTGGPIDSNTIKKNLRLRSVNTTSLTSVVTPSISPELVNLVDELTHYNLPFSFTGYIDVYFIKNLNNPQNGLNTGICGAARAFDQREDQFQLGMAQTKFGWNKKKVDAVIDLTFGPHADLGNYGNKFGPMGAGIGSSALAIKQAYIIYKLNTNNNFTFGQFGTHIGYEVIESYLNYNYSLSNLFNNGPFYHQGIKFTHNFGSKATMMVGLVNNWDNLYDNNSFKTAIAQITFSPKKNLFFSLNYIGGSEQSTLDSLQGTLYHTKPSDASFKQLLDFVANIQLSQKFYVGLNGAFGALQAKTVKDFTPPKLKTWGGAALYMNYSFTSKIGFGVRAELFDNSDGVQYIGKTDVQSYTGTFNLKLDQDLILRPEFRIDVYKRNHNGGHSTSEQFMNRQGSYSHNTQTTIGATVIYKF